MPLRIRAIDQYFAVIWFNIYIINMYLFISYEYTGSYLRRALYLLKQGRSAMQRCYTLNNFRDKRITLRSWRLCMFTFLKLWYLPQFSHFRKIPLISLSFLIFASMDFFALVLEEGPVCILRTVDDKVQ